MAAIAAATVFGNLSVLVALGKVRRAPSHYPLASLAMADLLIGLFVQPLGAARELFVFHLNWAICSCWSTLDVLCCTASILSLCALGWERWRGITAPLSRAQRFKKAKVYTALVWPTAALVALPTVFIPSPKSFQPGEIAKPCTVNTNVSYVFFSIFSSFYLPACVMVVMYAKILSALASPPQIRAHRGQNPCVEGTQGISASPNKETKPVPQSFFKDNIKKVTVYLSPKGCHLNVPGVSSDGVSPIQKSPCILSRQRRATRTIIRLMAMFLICWTPFFVMLPIDSLCDCVPDAAWQCCTWLGYLNSALNPIVYAAASPSVCRALHASLTTTSSTRSTRTTDIPMTLITRRVS